MKKLIVLSLFALGLARFVHHGMAQGTTAFYFTSSTNAFVGMGRSLFATNGGGYTFTASRNIYNGVTVYVLPQFGNSFSMNFAAPGNVPLASGDYLGVTRYPYQTATAGGLNFSAYGNGDNTLGGYFTVLDVSYGSGNSILSFAADFMQYDGGDLAKWNQGIIRFNSAVAVPEPHTSGLLVCAIGTALLTVRCRRLRHPAEQGGSSGHADSASVSARASSWARH
jgi:hypothetical protein